jgi:uncharacterized repeat protein (TIGR03803 family)
MSKFNWGMRACGVLLLWAGAAVALPAQTTVAPTVTFTTLHSFDYADGYFPDAALIQGTDGAFYGTTSSGGTNGYGTVFKITTGGTLTTVHTFDGTDGAYPNGGLAQGANGKLYGTTSAGGPNTACVNGGCGTVFTITPSGMLTTLYNFCSQSNCTDGYVPEAELVQGTDGNFYGTTLFGGASSACSNGCGTVFKITPGGTLTTLHSFDGTDGAGPQAGLIQATNGKFYGTTTGGGANGPYGTVFEITPSGKLTTLNSFDGTDGSEVDGSLVQATDGNFYGTTFQGGANHICGLDNIETCGEVFKMTPSGSLTVFYSFCSQGGLNCTDGEYPAAGLIQGTDGNFYGTTAGGGANRNGNICDYVGCGTAFKITPDGALTTLYNFCSQGDTCTDGAESEGALVQGTSGNFYGTTVYGGTSDNCFTGCGTIFSLSVGLGPFVETQPTVGEVGAAVNILGTNLTGSTKVTFHGTAATFTVKSKSEITTTVPVGATTGIVKVVTDGSTLSSNGPFRVTP